MFACNVQQIVGQNPERSITVSYELSDTIYASESSQCAGDDVKRVEKCCFTVISTTMCGFSSSRMCTLF